MQEQFNFEILEVPTATTDLVREALGSGHGALVVGGWGSGKSHAVARAVNGAVWSVVRDRPFAVPRLIADLSAQAGLGDEPVRAYADRGCEAACEALDVELGDNVIVVDGAERLWVAPLDPIDPSASDLWADELTFFRDWLLDRCNRTRTVVVASRVVPGVELRAKIVHQPPESSTIELVSSRDGYLDWKSVADRVGARPGAMRLASMALRFAGVHRMERWLDETVEEGARDATRRLGQLVRDHAPKQLVKVLVVVQASGELTTELLDEIAVSDEDLGLGVELAIHSDLLEERHGVLRVTPHLTWLGTIPSIDEVGAGQTLERASRVLLARVNDRSSLDPKSARAVLDAHDLQLATGDFDGALTTARLHLGGLIGHARAASVAANRPEEYDLARQAYASILRLLDSHAGVVDERVRSYVVHYRGYNGHRAQTIGLDRVAADYDAATSGWSGNALFHARRIALAAERGDRSQAEKHLADADAAVGGHPCKDSFLRVRPASWAHRAGAPMFALWLLDAYDAPPSLPDFDPLAHALLSRLYRTWRDHGVKIDRLAVPGGRELVFRAPLRFRVHREAHRWTAETEYPPARAEAAGPWSAVRALASAIADECVRLVSQPTGRLARHEVGRKGLYLGAVELSLSDLGLPHQHTRWLLGTLDAGRFVPDHSDLVPLPLDSTLLPESAEGMFFARVHVGRAGLPDGPIERLVRAGAGRTIDELLDDLRRMAGDGHEAA